MKKIVLLRLFIIISKYSLYVFIIQLIFMNFVLAEISHSQNLDQVKVSLSVDQASISQVTNENDLPLPSANVVLKGMNTGTTTDTENTQHIAFIGEPVAKTVLQVSCEGCPNEANIVWSISDSKDGGWKELPGIHSKEIVLLTQYIGKYLKCEITSGGGIGSKVHHTSVITNSPVMYNGNPNTDWFKDAGVGVMLHFLKNVYVKEGGSLEWNAVVDEFDVELFASNCKEAGAEFVLFSLGQNDGYYCSPNAAYDSIVGIVPGELCSTRDLPADLFKALDKRGIRMMLYLPGNPPIRNKLVAEKFRYTYGKDSPTSQFTQSCWEAVIREWSLRYGERNSGWWFDGMYRGGIIETRSDMSLKHNISTHTLAAKAGNHNSIVTYNYGVNTIQSNSPYDDYSAGEESKIVQVPQKRWVVDGVQWFLFTYLGKSWSQSGSRFETPALVQWAEKVFEKEGVVCFDINADKSGAINPDHIKQVQAVKETFDKLKKK